MLAGSPGLQPPSLCLGGMTRVWVGISLSPGPREEGHPSPSCRPTPLEPSVLLAGEPGEPLHPDLPRSHSWAVISTDYFPGALIGEEKRGWPGGCTLWGMLELVSPRLCSGHRKWLLSRYPKADLQSPALCPENWGFSFCTCPQYHSSCTVTHFLSRSPWPWPLTLQPLGLRVADESPGVLDAAQAGSGHPARQLAQSPHPCCPSQLNSSHRLVWAQPFPAWSFCLCLLVQRKRSPSRQTSRCCSESRSSWSRGEEGALRLTGDGRRHCQWCGRAGHRPR